MGIKMSKAYCINERKEVHVSSVDPDNRGTYRCKNDSCRIPVIFNQASTNKSGAVIRRAYFRRQNKNDEHIPTCEFNTKGRVEAIAAQTRNNNILENIQEGKYLFRLNLLTEAINYSATINKGTGSGQNQDTPHTDRTQRTYRPGNPLPPYLSTMKKILELRAELEDNASIKSHIQLKHKQTKVNWDNFYFEDDRYKDCFNEASRNSHVVCVLGTVFEHNKPKDKFPYHTLKLSTKGKVESGIYQIPYIEVILFDKTIAGKLPLDSIEGKQIIVYGVPQTKKSDIINTPKGDRQYLNITFGLNHFDQILVL